MASGGYVHKTHQQLAAKEEPRTQIPARTSRSLPEVANEDVQEEYYNKSEIRLTDSLKPLLPTGLQVATIPLEAATSVRQSIGDMIDNYKRNARWLKPWSICVILVICFMTVLLSAGIVQQSVSISVSSGQVYSMQVGGNQANTWQHDPQSNIPSQSGPYSVMGNPSITADFINQVLSSYNSPAAGKGQALYDLGKQYGIDPAFALAFFMHESSFGTQGEATKSLSLGNLRCIPNFRCADNFAQFDTWEDGFKAWYQLIRNLYVAQWNLTTVDQIIPRYAPTSDNNNEQGYIAALKHAIDTWHAGQIIVS